MRSKHERTKSKMSMGHTKMFPSISCAPSPNNSGRECLHHKIMRGGSVFSSTHTSAEWEEGAGNVLACFRLLCLCDTSSLEVVVLRYWTLKLEKSKSRNIDTKQKRYCTLKIEKSKSRKVDTSCFRVNTRNVEAFAFYVEKRKFGVN
jgi:hypothetical protein